MKIFRVQFLFAIFFAAKISFCTAGLSSDTLSPLVTYKHYGEEDGLHCKTVYEAIQDKDGFMWFATDAGAFRFDGKTFRQYSIEQGVADKEVLKIFQDSYGRIWFLTLNGYFSFFKNGKIYNASNAPFLKQAYVGGGGYLVSYFVDSKKRIWFCTSRHIFTVIDKDSVRHVSPEDTVANISYLGSQNVHEDASGNIWTFGSDRMYPAVDGSTKDSIKLPSTIYIACHSKKNSEMYFMAKSGATYKISHRKVSLYAAPADFQVESKIVNMVADEDNIWFCTQGSGCLKMVNGKFAGRYLDHMAIASVFRDRENNLWFNTMGEGIYMMPSTADFVKNYNQQSGLSASHITCFLPDAEQGFWLGYKNGIVDKIDKNRVSAFKLNRPDDPEFNRVTSMTIDSNGILCGTDMGVYFIRNNDIQYVHFERTTRDIHYVVKQLFISNEGNIYVAHGGGLLLLVKDHSDFFAKPLLKAGVRTTAITQYPDSRLLLATTDGLMEYLQGTVQPFHTDIDFSTTRILDMKRIPFNFLALATNGSGIYFLQDKKLYQRLTTDNGLSDNNCKRIFVSDSTVYLATDKGLNILLKKNNRWFVSAVLTSKNGLLSNTVSDAAELDRKIYVATDKGLSVFDKAAIFRQIFVGKVYATELITDSAYTVTDTVYNFKADIPRLLIRFAYPVFGPANDLEIKYRLLRSEGDKSDWIRSSENNEVEFSSLSPGKYIFQLRPDIPSVKEAGITNIYLNIIPLWWQTSAARVAFGLLIIGLLAAIIRSITRMQYRKELRQMALLEAERTRIASDMHDDIGADLTQISIWSNILNSGNRDASVVTRITKSSNEVLQKMEQIIWALNSYNNHATDLVSYLREYSSQYLESAGIILSFEISGILPELEISAIQKRNVFLTVKELLHNTVKHSGAKNVLLNIYAEESTLTIEYTDDGKGFVTTETGDGMGNITVQKRMKEINSTITVKSSPGKGFNAQLRVKLDERLKANHSIV